MALCASAEYATQQRQVMVCAGFLAKLQTYDKDNIPPAVIEKIKPYMENPDFEPEVVKKASKAAFGLVSWVRAMEAYDRCNSTYLQAFHFDRAHMQCLSGFGCHRFAFKNLQLPQVCCSTWFRVFCVALSFLT